MTEKSYPYKFKDDKPYTTDIGTTSAFNFSLKAPSDLTEAQIIKIIECVGELRVGTSSPCSEKGIIKPRKIKFIRANNNSFTLYFPDRSTLIKDAQCVWDILKQTDNKPLCAQLTGEFWYDMIDTLNIAKKDGDTINKNPIQPPKDSAKHKLIYSGTMKAYKSDSVKSGNTNGGVIFQPFSMQSDQDLDKDGNRQPYSELIEEIVGCHGELTTIRTCGGNKTKRESRAFIPSIAVEFKADGGVDNSIENKTEGALQTLTIPVAENTSAKIKDCGEKIGKYNWVICLAYQGESYGLFHKLLT